MVFGGPASWALFCCNSRKRRTDWEDEWRLSAIAYGLVHIRIRTYAYTYKSKTLLYCLFLSIGLFSLTGVSNTLVSVSSSKKVFSFQSFKDAKLLLWNLLHRSLKFLKLAEPNKVDLKDRTIGRKNFQRSIYVLFICDLAIFFFNLFTLIILWFFQIRNKIENATS